MMNAATRRQRLTQLLLGATLSLVIAFAIALSDRITTYEISPYDSIPIAFWIATTAAYVTFSYAAFQAAKDNSTGKIGVGLLGLTLLSTLLMALPALRYRTYYTQWDVWFHVGYASNIAQTGHVNLDENFYPSLHILWVNIAQATGIEVFDLGIFLAAPLVALVVPLSYIVSSRVFRNPSVGAISASLAVFPNGIVGTFPAPWFYALVLLLLLFVAIVIRSGHSDLSTTSLGIVVVLSLVLSHPLAPIFLILALVLVTFQLRLLNRAKVGRRVSESKGKPSRIQVGTSFFALLVVSYVAWISFLTLALQTSLRQIIASISRDGIVSPIGYGRFFSASLLAKTYGGIAILGVYWLGSLVVLKRQGLRSSWAATSPLISLALSALILAVMFQNLVSGLGIQENLGRPITVAALALPLLAGFFIADIGKRLKRNSTESGVLIVAIVVPFLLALPAAYPSPYIALFNYENTQGVYASVDWAAAYLPLSDPILSNSYIGRYAFALQTRGPTYQKLFHFENTLPSDLTGFVNPTSKPTYFIVDRETIDVAGMDLRGWNSPSPSIIIDINRSPVVTRLYDNGDVQIYLSGPD